MIEFEMETNVELRENFERLNKEQENYLKACNQKINSWEKFKDDYLALRKRLETLPHELRYDVMIPISKKAFMTGRLVNTNEILVLLGDNWFVEKSAKQACDLIDRRLVNIDKFLEDLNKEKKIVDDQIDWTKNLLKEKGEYVNIEEKFDEFNHEKPKKKEITEEEKKEIRKKLQEKALKTAEEIDKKIKQEKNLLYKKNEPKEDEEAIEKEEEEEEEKDSSEKSNFIKQLENDIKNMDLEEKFPDYEFIQEDETKLKEMMKDYEKNINRENNQLIEKAFKTNSDIKKTVKWSDVQEEQNKYETNDEEREEFDEEDDYDDDEEEEEEKEELIEPEPIVIKIKHTKNELLNELELNQKLSRDKPEVNSPGDIYNVFYKPKSILKNKNIISDSTESIYKSEDKIKELKINEEPKNAELEKFEPHKAFTGEIIERNFNRAEKIEINEPAKKTTSKFKASKFSQKN